MTCHAALYYYCSAPLLSLYLNMIIKKYQKRQKSSLQLGFAAWILWVVSLYLSTLNSQSLTPKETSESDQMPTVSKTYHFKYQFGRNRYSHFSCISAFRHISIFAFSLTLLRSLILQTKSQKIQFRRNGRRLSLSQFWIFSSTSSDHFSTSFSCSFASLLFESACSVWLPRKLLKLNQCFFFLN